MTSPPSKTSSKERAIYPLSERDHPIARPLPELFGMQTRRGTAKQGNMLCSSLRLGHIREVRDIRTNCLQNAGKVLLVSLFLNTVGKAVAYLRSTCGERLKVRSRRTLALRSTFAGRLKGRPKWNHRSRRSTFAQVVQ
jgi:hypothetical protein